MTTSSARHIDENGFMLVRGCRISRAGVFEYSAKQVYPAGHEKMGDPDRIIGVYRPESEIRDPDSINSFKSLPFINEHEMLAGDTASAKYPEDSAPEDYGIDGVLTDNVYFDESDGWLKGDVKVWAREAFGRIQDGKDDLSAGMNCKFKLEGGTFQGKPYEVTQIHMRGNHLANVDEARVEGARILDSRCFDSANLSLTITPHEVSEMPKPIKGRAADSALDELKKLVPALQSIIEKGQTGELDDADAGAVNDDAHVPDTALDAEGGDEAAVPEATDDVDANHDDAEADSDDVKALVEQAKALLQQVQELIVNSGSSDMEETPEVAVGDEGDVAADTDNDRQVMDAEEIVAKAEDRAVRRIYADNAKKDKLYQRLSNVVGAFDARAMDSKAVAAYGIKKLGLTASKGQESIVLDAYLTGVSATQRSAAATIKGRAADSKAETVEMSKWLAEGAK